MFSYELITTAVCIGFLPSSFSMYAMSLSSALYLFEKPAAAVLTAATGVILGWPFSVLAFLPLTIFSLKKRFKHAFLSGVITSLFLLVSLSSNMYNKSYHKYTYYIHGHLLLLSDSSVM